MNFSQIVKITNLHKKSKGNTLSTVLYPFLKPLWISVNNSTFSAKIFKRSHNILNNLPKQLNKVHWSIIFGEGWVAFIFVF